jgi:N-acetylglucosaminyldiphosphoundecaprenol N-acetyl-beta-D-mannosaminyltransferase
MDDQRQQIGTLADGGRVELFGIPVDALTLDQTIDRIRGWVEAGGVHQHVAVNAAKIVALTDSHALAGVIRNCHMVSPDGAPVVWASRLLRRPLPERVSGVDLMERLVEVAAETGRKVFFLGAHREIVQEVVEVFRSRHPSLEVVGYHDGYWSDDDEVIGEIRRARPDYLFVGIPSPRKELWLAAHLEELAVPFVMGVGGSFDVVTGRYRRAPGWVCAHGLEWLWRLCQEPRRLWKRYLFGNTRFLALLGREWLHARRNGGGR